jgi:hypothetical protein
LAHLVAVTLGEDLPELVPGITQSSPDRAYKESK